MNQMLSQAVDQNQEPILVTSQTRQAVALLDTQQHGAFMQLGKVGATKSTLVKVIKLLMLIIVNLVINLIFVLGVKDHPVVTEGQEESPDHLRINVNTASLVVIFKHDLIPYVCDLVDQVEDEDDGDDDLDVTHAHIAKEALSGRRLLWSSHLMIMYLASILISTQLITSGQSTKRKKRRPRAQMANQNCCTNATRIVVTSDESFIQDLKCCSLEDETRRRTSV